MKKQKVLLLGATGLVGSIVQEKIANSQLNLEIFSFVRNKDTNRPSTVMSKTIDFKNLKQEVETLKPNVIICSLGTTLKKAGSKKAFRNVDYELPLNAAHGLGRESRFILISSIGADKKSNFFYLRTKGELESALKRFDFKLLIYRPSILSGGRSEKRVLESLWLSFVSFLPSWKSFEPLRPTNPIDIADDILSELGRSQVKKIVIKQGHKVKEIS